MLRILATYPVHLDQTQLRQRDSSCSWDSLLPCLPACRSLAQHTMRTGVPGCSRPLLSKALSSASICSSLMLLTSLL